MGTCPWSIAILVYHGLPKENHGTNPVASNSLQNYVPSILGWEALRFRESWKLELKGLMMMMTMMMMMMIIDDDDS